MLKVDSRYSHRSNQTFLLSSPASPATHLYRSPLARISGSHQGPSSRTRRLAPWHTSHTLQLLWWSTLIPQHRSRSFRAARHQPHDHSQERVLSFAVPRSRDYRSRCGDFQVCRQVLVMERAGPKAGNRLAATTHPSLYHICRCCHEMSRSRSATKALRVLR
jgi:hypothetical protein